MTSYWLSSNRMTVLVRVDDNHIVTNAAPVVHKFIGQPFSNLRRWMQGHGGLRVQRLPETYGPETT